MSLDFFDYPLPSELVAQEPAADRSQSRLLVIRRKDGTFRDLKFADLPSLMDSGDVLVLNDTKVFPARLIGRKKITGGKVEVLLLGPSAEDPMVWQCLLQPALKIAQKVEFAEGACGAEFIRRNDQGLCQLRFESVDSVRDFALKYGQMPLPPYIRRLPDQADRDRYQTVYAKVEGAVAAPTAGLHFTQPLLTALADKGVQIESVTLHVGYGTFKPVEDPLTHRMHAESFQLKADVAERLNLARQQHRPITAVGTTTLRVLETCVADRKILPGSGQTDLYIRPPFEFEAVDRLLTNFHLPRTTLLLLVGAFMGPQLAQKAYAHAIARKYRFYSYGDAMLII